MDEHPHRRRRHAAQPPQTPPSAPQFDETPTEAPQAQNAPQAEGQRQPSAAQAHHRRRRKGGEEDTAPAQAEGAGAPQEDALFWHPESELLDKMDKQPQEKKAAAPLRLLSSADALVCRLGDMCLSALRWAGVLLLFAGGFIAGGAKKLGRRAKALLRSTGKKPVAGGSVHTGRRMRPKKRQQSPEQTQEVTIEPIMPEAYQGMGDKRAQQPAFGARGGKKRVLRAPGRRVSVMYSAAMAGFLCMALVSVYMISSIVYRSVSTKRLSSELSKRYTQLSEQAPENTPAPDEEAQPQTQDGAQMPDEATIAAILQATTGPTMAPPPELEEEPEAQATAAPKKKDVVASTKYHQVGGDALPAMEALYQDNRDLIGWLRMEGILDLPVVYKDNKYYLTRDFYKNKSASGTLFLDENHPFRENAQNLLLHGHNMKDGTMFGRLVQYETNLQFLKNNPFIQYSTLWKEEQYVIFAVLHVSLDTRSSSFFNYFTHHTFSSDTQFENYVRALQNRSVFAIPVDVEPSDALLTLSTCLDEDRLVIVARRLREGESKSELRHLVQLSAKQSTH